MSRDISEIAKNIYIMRGDMAAVSYTHLDGDDTLFMLFEVQDKTISLVGANPWEQDSIEYFLQTENSTDSAAAKTQVRYLADGSSELPADSQAAFKETDGGFLYEISCDISAVGEMCIRDRAICCAYSACCTFCTRCCARGVRRECLRPQVYASRYRRF